MATKVKPSRLNITGTPQVGQVPVYVDDDNFQWGAGGGGGNVKSFTLSSTSDLTNAQAAYDWYDDGNVAIIIYNDKEYLFDYATAGNAYWSAANEEAYDTASSTGINRASLQLALSSGTVTGVTTLNISVNDLKVLRTDKNYGTPYSPQYDGSPATKKYVDDSVADLMGLGKFLSLWDATTGLPDSFPLQTPYTYSTGDYYLVGTISTATPPVNYKPNGSSYTGTASSTTESEELAVGDIYIYDGTNWLLQLNHGKTISFSEIAGNPSDNTNLANALNAKANASDLNLKAFTLANSSDTVTAQAAYDWYNSGKTPILCDNTGKTYLLKGYSYEEYNGDTYLVLYFFSILDDGGYYNGIEVWTLNDTVSRLVTVNSGAVLTSGNQTIAGTKTFSTSPVVPSKTSDATNTGTAIATEAQVYKKQDTLVNQTNIKSINGNSLLGSGDLTISGGITNDTTGTTSTVTGIWAGSEAEYTDLATKSGTVLYFTF